MWHPPYQSKPWSWDSGNKESVFFLSKRKNLAGAEGINLTCAQGREKQQTEETDAPSGNLCSSSEICQAGRKRKGNTSQAILSYTIDEFPIASPQISKWVTSFLMTNTLGGQCRNGNCMTGVYPTNAAFLTVSVCWGGGGGCEWLLTVNYDWNNNALTKHK